MVCLHQISRLWQICDIVKGVNIEVMAGLISKAIHI